MPVFGSVATRGGNCLSPSDAFVCARVIAFCFSRVLCFARLLTSCGRQPYAEGCVPVHLACLLQPQPALMACAACARVGVSWRTLYILSGGPLKSLPRLAGLCTWPIESVSFDNKRTCCVPGHVTPTPTQ